MSSVVHHDKMLLFPTVLGVFSITDAALLARVAAEIDDRARTQPTVARGERTGWQSANDVLSWPSGRELGALIGEAVGAMSPTPDGNGDHDEHGVFLAAWANRLVRGDYFTPHTHADAAWSGVLYIDAADSGESHGGFLSFRDPRAGAGMVATAANRHDSACTLHHYPRTGELIVFPAWLVHWVVPYQSDRPRLSVAFNAR